MDRLSVDTMNTSASVGATSPVLNSTFSPYRRLIPANSAAPLRSSAITAIIGYYLICSVFLGATVFLWFYSFNLIKPQRHSEHRFTRSLSALRASAPLCFFLAL